MKLTSINISKPIAIEYEGEMITTGIFKKPVAGLVFVGNEHLAGDGQADLQNHGGESKAVYAFSADHYPYWCDTLHADLQAGAFGENLTIAGLDESALHIGDRLRVGSCLLEITQPRVPCFKLAIAMNNKKMPKLFVNRFETGVYLRVIEEGEVAVDNNVEVVQLDPSGLSVKALFRAVFDKHYKDTRDTIEQALAIPALSQEWRIMLEEKLAGLK